MVLYIHEVHCTIYYLRRASTVIAYKVKNALWCCVIPTHTIRWFTNVDRESGLETPKEELWSTRDSRKCSKQMLRNVHIITFKGPPWLHPLNGGIIQLWRGRALVVARLKRRVGTGHQTTSNWITTAVHVEQSARRINWGVQNNNT